MTAAANSVDSPQLSRSSGKDALLSVTKYESIAAVARLCDNNITTSTPNPKTVSAMTSDAYDSHRSYRSKEKAVPAEFADLNAK